MKILDNLLFYLSVPKCVACGEKLDKNERALCSSCIKEYENHKQRQCSSCFRILSHCSCPNEHLDAHFVHKLVKVYRYVARGDNVSNKLIYSIKNDNRKDVFDFLSDELASAIRNSISLDDGYIVTSVPRSKGAIVRFGYDHAALLAKMVAQKLQLRSVRILRSKSNKQQKKSKNKEERIKNAVYKLKNRKLDFEGKNFIVIDDIVTTGASIGAVAMNLKSVGAKKIVGATLSIAYKDEKSFIV